MAYTFATLKTNSIALAEHGSFATADDALITAQCSAALLEVVEKIQTSKPDFPGTLVTDLAFTDGEETIDLPTGFRKPVSLSHLWEGGEVTPIYLCSINSKPLSMSANEMFYYYDQSDTWKLSRNPNLGPQNVRLFYLGDIGEQATNSTLDLTFLPRTAISLIETRVAKLLLATKQRRNPVLEFRESKLETELNDWLMSQSEPRFVTYRGR